jgi:hypothetical protein
MGNLRGKMPSPAMVVAVVALIVALAGTAYAAQTINGGAIKKQTIGGGKLKKKTLTGYQINTNKLGVVPAAKAANRATHTFWAVVSNPAGPENATLARASDSGIAVAEHNGAVFVGFTSLVNGCVDVAGSNSSSTSVPSAGYAQTNLSPGKTNLVEVHTRDEKGVNVDSDFHLIVICP